MLERDFLYMSITFTRKRALEWEWVIRGGKRGTVKIMYDFADMYCTFVVVLRGYNANFI